MTARYTVPTGRWPEPPPREVPDSLAFSVMAIVIMALLTVFA